MKKIFFDTEFTDLKKDAELISICLIDENDNCYDAVLDFDISKCSDYVKKNVLPNLPTTKFDINEMLNFIGTENVEFWGYAPQYDWVFFCEIFGGALNLPKNIFWIPKDCCSLSEKLGYNFDTNPIYIFPQSGYGARQNVQALKLYVKMVENYVKMFENG